jgi:small conductance mechanosensitive channel
MIELEDVGANSEKIFDFALGYGIKLLIALLLLVVGRWVIKKFVNLSVLVMEKNELDTSLRSFLRSLIAVVLNVLLFISIASSLDIQTTSFVALIGAAGLAVGLALQGTLSNFAGGILILLFKPYEIDDFIEAQGESGNVKEIQIFVTVILTPRNRTVIIPNGAISNGNIINYTKAGKVRLDLVFGISYDASIKEARKVLMEVMVGHDKVLKEPAPFVGVEELGDSSVNLAVRPYCAPKDYWDVYFDVMEEGKEALDKANISIPFPQMDVHMEK